MNYLHIIFKALLLEQLLNCSSANENTNIFKSSLVTELQYTYFSERRPSNVFEAVFHV